VARHLQRLFLSALTISMARLAVAAAAVALVGQLALTVVALVVVVLRLLVWVRAVAVLVMVRLVTDIFGGRITLNTMIFGHLLLAQQRLVVRVLKPAALVADLGKLARLVVVRPAADTPINLGRALAVLRVLVLAEIQTSLGSITASDWGRSDERAI
jgi:hypothetical protein